MTARKAKPKPDDPCVMSAAEADELIGACSAIAVAQGEYAVEFRKADADLAQSVIDLQQELTALKAFVMTENAMDVSTRENVSILHRRCDGLDERVTRGESAMEIVKVRLSNQEDGIVARIRRWFGGSK